MIKRLLISTAIMSLCVSCGGGTSKRVGDLGPLAPNFDTKLLEGSWIQKQKTSVDALSGKTLVLQADEWGRIDEPSSFNGNLGYSLWAFTIHNMSYAVPGGQVIPIKVEGSSIGSIDSKNPLGLGNVTFIDSKKLVLQDSFGTNTFVKTTDE